MQMLNDPRPWWAGTEGQPLTIADLIANETLPAWAAATLWWAIEQGASVFTVAGPQRAGKTTMTSALFSFLPEDARVYVTSGAGDPIDVPLDAAPTYLLINELSNHMPVYLYGPSAWRAFALLREGVKVLGTLHADNAAEAVAVMHDESRIPYDDIARVTLIVVLRAGRVPSGIIRRIVEIGLLLPDERGVRVIDVAGWDRPNARLALPDPPAGLTALAAWAGAPLKSMAKEIERRAGFLEALVEQHPPSLEAVTEAVQRFRSG